MSGAMHAPSGLPGATSLLDGHINSVQGSAILEINDPGGFKILKQIINFVL